MAPVPIPSLDPAEDARLTATRIAASLHDANGRLVCSRDWYAGIQEDYAR